MNFNKISVFLLLIMYSSNSNAQLVKENDFDFLISKIKNVYAGYDFKNKKFDRVVQRAKVSNFKDSFSLFSSLTTSFNDYHLSLFQRINFIDSNESLYNLKYIEKKEKDHHSNNYWIDELGNSIIYLDKSEANTFAGYIVESIDNLPPGYRLFEIAKRKSKKMLTDYNYLSKKFRVFTFSYFVNPTTLIIGSYSKWKKLPNYKPGMLNSKKKYQINPSVVALDSNTTLITMPDFSPNLSDFYDSLIVSNFDKLSTCKNLVIDIRGNQGGVIDCFYKLLPFICTNKIFTPSGYTLVSEDIISDVISTIDLAKKDNDTSTFTLYNDYFDKIKNQKGKLFFSEGDSINCKVKVNKIVNVGLIVDYGCRSAAELMILYLKQSKKVKTFGENTAGAIDYLSLYDYYLPNSKYYLWVGTIKRHITKSQPLFDKDGIPPDIKINNQRSDWVDFVKKYYEKN